MATALLYIGWNRPVAGKEAEAWKYFMEEGDAALSKFQKQGFFERVAISNASRQALKPSRAEEFENASESPKTRFASTAMSTCVPARSNACRLLSLEIAKSRWLSAISASLS